MGTQQTQHELGKPRRAAASNGSEYLYLRRHGIEASLSTFRSSSARVQNLPVEKMNSGTKMAKQFHYTASDGLSQERKRPKTEMFSF